MLPIACRCSDAGVDALAESKKEKSENITWGQLANQALADTEKALEDKMEKHLEGTFLEDEKNMIEVAKKIFEALAEEKNAEKK